MLNIAKYGGEAIATELIGGAFYLLPPYASLRVATAQANRAERRLNALTQQKRIK